MTAADAAVRVLVMAKNKKNRKENAGDTLFGRLGRNSAKKAEHSDELLGEDFDFPAEDAEQEMDFDSIDVTAAGDASDSDLDINELLRKYMPEYSDESSESGTGGGNGVLARLKQSGGAAGESADDKLISALDSVFSSSVEEEPAAGAEELPDEFAEEDVPEDEEPEEDFAYAADAPEEFPEERPETNEKALKKGGFFAGFGKRKAAEETFEEYELEEIDGEEAVPAEELPELSEEDGIAEEEAEAVPADDVPDEAFAEEYAEDEPLLEEISEEDFTEVFEEEAPKKRFGFGFLKKKKKKKSTELEEIAAIAEEELLQEDESFLEDAPELAFADELAEAAEGEGAAEEMAEEDAAELRLEPEETPETDEPADVEETDERIEELPEETESSDEDFTEEPIDSTDMNLMIAFGLDNQGGRKTERVKEFGDRLEAKQQSHTAVQKVKLDRPEFVDKTQTPKIRKEFRRRSTALWMKLGLCVVFTVLLMLFENIEVVTKLFTGSAKQFGGVFDPAVYPTVYIMMSLQLMLLACLCAYEQILDGFKYLFRGIPKPETMLSIMTVLGILYSVILVRLTSGEPVMFNFMVALTAMFTLIYAIYNHKREMLNFRIVANKKPKHIVRRLPDEQSEGEARAFEDNDEVCDVMKIEKTDFIDGFFGRLSKPDPATTHFMAALLSAMGAIAILFGILTYVRGGEADAVLGSVYAALLIVAPLSIYITFSYPFYRANVAAKEYDSAIIGDASLEEYSNASIISFDDKNVFPSYSVKLQNIRICNNARIDRVFYYAASVFAYAGGPLQDVFEFATVEMGHSSNVKIFDTERGFLATQVDGVNIIFGTYDALTKRGLEISDSDAADDVDLSDELSIMYMFRENKLIAKMYIMYVMDADIDLILKQFSGSGLYVCVRTFDPNIDERMIARKLNMKRMPLKIVRYASAEEVTFYEEKVDSGLVTCGSPKSLLQVISYCEKVLRTKKTNIALSVLSVMIGAAILVLLLLSNSMGLLNSLYIAIYQLIWMVPLAISSRMFIR